MGGDGVLGGGWRRWSAAAIVCFLVLSIVAWLGGWGLCAQAPNLSQPSEAGLQGAPASEAGASNGSGVVAVADLPKPMERFEREGHAPVESESSGKATIHVQILERGTGRPARNVEIQTLPSRVESFHTDEEGRVTIIADPGDFALLLETGDTYYFCGEPEDPQNTEWIATWDNIEAGRRYEVTADVIRSATIRGRWVFLSGEVDHGELVYWSPQVGGQWGVASGVRIRRDGSFSIKGLAPNRYLLGPQPRSAHAFPFEIVTLDWGEVKVVEVREPEKVPLNITVGAVQKGSGESWPMPFVAKLVRDDTMASLMREHAFPLSLSALGHGVATISGDVPPGIYRLTVASTGMMHSKNLSWIGTDWSESETVTVIAGEPVERETTVETPACGEVAWVSGQVLLEGEKRPSLKVTYVNAMGASKSMSLFLADPKSRSEDGTMSFRLGVDLDLVPSRMMEIRRHIDRSYAVVQSIALVPGDQAVIVPVR